MDDSQSLEAALPVGFEVVRRCPPLTSGLVGRPLVFQFRGTGWQFGRIRQHYSQPRGHERFTYEVAFGSSGQEIRDTRLQLDRYGTDQPAAWYLIQKA